LIRLSWIVVLGVIALFGALNGRLTEVDFLAFRVQVPVGVALMASLLLGALAGGLAIYVGSVMPLKRRSASARADRAIP
jgi:uncharacterized integral membrane protein